MKKIILLLNLIVVWETNISKAQNIDSIRHILDSTYSKSPFFGNVLITKNDKIIFEKSYGYADAISKKPLTKDNSFQVASISKQFTAYGIMILKDKGFLDYDSLVNKYMPSFPYSNITVRHLLTHTSGLPNFWDDIRPKMDTTKSFGNKEVLDYLFKNKLPLQFEPGTKFDYCDIGYDFLANIIENISGLNYQDFMEKNIFKPLKMKNTFAYMVTDIRRIKNKNLAIGHTHVNGKFEYAHLQPKNNFVFYLGDFYGDGSVVTSARDLAKWDKALKNCELLACDFQKESFTEAKFNNQIIYAGKDVAYGFGWFLKNTPSGKLVYHTGFHPGNVDAIYRLIDKDIAFIFLSDAESTNIRDIRRRILQLL
ncbi:MAG: serine hydrolase domain-containing protein [Bacteroidia bacterium]